MRMGRFDGPRAGSAGADAADLIDTIDALESDLDLEEGTLIRELTAIIGRRRRFAALRRDHDFRFR
ncbi:hypothetical protein SAMN05216456_1455 [Devosia crocina]|uniref:Uncharacterized protein n=2 Tax=Devosia crocina TaxID=429728 RepID=A0A1I7NAR6_9HYPH|nr:hypothetical protein SAMN05216456_1455 [Devosia crocina]